MAVLKIDVRSKKIGVPVTKPLSLLGLVLISACSASVTGTNPEPDAATQPDAPAAETNASTDGGQSDVQDASSTDSGSETGTAGECMVGATRHCYSGPPGTEGIGQCRGATRYCVRGDNGSGQWSPDCVTEVTPYPWGDQPRDGIDNDCDGTTDEDDQHLNGASDEVCDPRRGCFWFCEPYEARGSDVYGYRGCCTSGRFRSLSDVGGMVHGGMLIKGSGAAVYAIAGDRRRHVFPTSTTLATWGFTTASGVNIRRHAEVCMNVTEVTDEVLAGIPLGRNMTYRPGVVITGLTSDPTRYVVSRGAVLRAIAYPERGLPTVGGPTTLYSDLNGLMPDFVFVNYTIGAPVEGPSDYDHLVEWNTTIDAELGIMP